MSVHQLQSLSKDLLAPLAWHEFWMGIVAGAVLGTTLYELLVYMFCR